MGEAERIIKAREEQNAQGHLELRRELSLEFAQEIELLVPQAIDALRASGYQRHTRFIDIDNEQHASWELFSHFSEGDISGYRVYLLAEGQLVREYPYIGKNGATEFHPFNMHEIISHSPDPTDFKINLDNLKTLINVHNQLAAQ